MRRILAALFATILVVTIAGAWWISREAAPNTIQIALSSQPFPLAVGQDTLLVALTHSDGSPVENATVRVEANYYLAGQYPLAGSSRQSENGIYRVPMIWSTNNRWIVDVTAEVGDETITDQFTVFVYPIQQQSLSNTVIYPSMKEIAAFRASHPEEFWIVIPQGTNAMIREGHGEDVMPNEIRLKVNGQNTLVIQNNDIADHTIGPFFVRAGETLRQTYTEPQVYEGVCSVRHDAVISIIVE